MGPAFSRGNPGDAYKLAHWDDCRQRRFEPSGAQLDGLVVFGNTAPDEAAFDALLQRITQAAPPST